MRIMLTSLVILTNSPTAIALGLGVSAVGGILSPTAPDMGAAGVLDRYRQIRPRMLIVERSYRYGGKRIDLMERWKQVVDELRKFGLEQCAWIPTGLIIPMLPIDLSAPNYRWIIRLFSNHISTGEYKSRFLLSSNPEDESDIDTSCPCGHEFQSLHHLLQDCIFGDFARHLLPVDLNGQIIYRNLLSSSSQRKKLLHFIHCTYMFTPKYGIDTRPIQ